MHATTVNAAEYEKPRNPGHFRKGDDPRRAGGLKLYAGLTLSQMARALCPEILAFWDRTWRDENVPLQTRIEVSKLIVERGHGKPTVNLELTESRPLASLSLHELEAIAAGEAPRLPITLDGEAVDVTSTASVTAADNRSDVT